MNVPRGGNAVGPVGGNNPRRAAFDPAGGVESIFDSSIVIGNNPASFIKWGALKGDSSVANGRNYEPAGNVKKFPRADGAATFNPGSLQSDAFDLVSTQNFARRCKKFKMNAVWFFVRLTFGKLAEGFKISFL